MARKKKTEETAQENSKEIEKPQKDNEIPEAEDLPLDAEELEENLGDKVEEPQDESEDIESQLDKELEETLAEDNEEPKITSPKSSRSNLEESAPPPPKTSTIVLAKDDIADRLSEQLEEEEEKIHRDFKYLSIGIIEEAINEYIIVVKGQGHGFCNYFVSKLLKTKGITFAAYKVTSLEPSKVIIRTDGSKEIKVLLKDTLKIMQIELKGLGNAIASAKI